MGPRRAVGKFRGVAASRGCQPWGSAPAPPWLRARTRVCSALSVVLALSPPRNSALLATSGHRPGRPARWVPAAWAPCQTSGRARESRGESDPRGIAPRSAPRATRVPLGLARVYLVAFTSEALLHESGLRGFSGRQTEKLRPLQAQRPPRPPGLRRVLERPSWVAKPCGARPGDARGRVPLRTLLERLWLLCVSSIVFF